MSALPSCQLGFMFGVDLDHLHELARRYLPAWDLTCMQGLGAPWLPSAKRREVPPKAEPGAA